MAQQSLKDFFMSIERWRLSMAAAAIMGLAVVFLFQNLDLLKIFCDTCDFHPYTHFVVRKFLRVALNDTFMLLLIHALFRDPAITKLAWYVQLVDMLILLPAYLVIKLVYEGDSEISMPLLSQLHRLIVNPTLMVLLIPAVYYQRLRKGAH
ncbi:MAG TPA: exosortase F system-associated protein [Cyclobacteriaceae bacterium]|nr:exosortase F system-associated protein [Cyclobacteriaceae bacterium]